MVVGAAVTHDGAMDTRRGIDRRGARQGCRMGARGAMGVGELCQAAYGLPLSAPAHGRRLGAVHSRVIARSSAAACRYRSVGFMAVSPSGRRWSVRWRVVLVRRRWSEYVRTQFVARDPPARRCLDREAMPRSHLQAAGHPLRNEARVHPEVLGQGCLAPHGIHGFGDGIHAGKLRRPKYVSQ